MQTSPATIFLLFLFMLANPLRAQESDIQIPPDLALRSIARFEQDPLGPESEALAFVISNFAGQSYYCEIIPFEQAMPWFDTELPFAYSGPLMSAYLAGNIRSQLESNRIGDDPYAGAVMMLEVYELIKEENPRFSVPELEELIVQRDRQALRQYLESAKLGKGVEPGTTNPWVEPQTGIPFPATLGPLHKVGARLYDDPKIGTSIRYQMDDSTKADLFLYHGGQNDLGNGLQNDKVRIHFIKLTEQIAQMQERGIYQNMELLVNEIKPIKTTQGTLDAYIVAHTYQQTPQFEGDYEGQRFSWTVLTAYDGYFLKIRFTYYGEESDVGGAAFTRFLAALGTLL